jgi:hypothetical protein
MVDGPKNEAELGEFTTQNAERIEASIRDAELAHVAGVVPQTLEDVIEQRPVTPLSERGRARVDDLLEAIQATKEGVFTRFYIEHSDETCSVVTQENADEVEAHVRNHFSPYYPEIAVATQEA